MYWFFNNTSSCFKLEIIVHYTRCPDSVIYHLRNINYSSIFRFQMLNNVATCDLYFIFSEQKYLKRFIKFIRKRNFSFVILKSRVISSLSVKTQLDNSTIILTPKSLYNYVINFIELWLSKLISVILQYIYLSFLKIQVHKILHEMSMIGLVSAKSDWSWNMTFSFSEIFKKYSTYFDRYDT